MSEWKKVRLGEVADLCLGKMLDAKKNKGIPRPYLNNVAVRWGQFNLNELPEMKIEEEEVERYSIVKGDIVICEGGEPGRCAVWKSDEPIFFQKALHRARVKSCCDSNFIYYQFCHLVKVGETKSFETGSTIRHLPAQELKQIPISLPPLPTQRKIAAVLGALDDKIENNRKICANLEAQAQAIFKSWFVDFEPFGGKMPQGWKMGKLGDVAECNPYRALKKGVKARCVEMADLVTSASFPASWSYKEYSGGMKFANGDTIIARITPCFENGKSAYVNFLEEGEVAFGSTEYVVMASRSVVPPELFYCVAKDPEFISFAKSRMVGSSGRQRFSAEDIAMYPIVIAPDEVYLKVQPLLRSFMDQVRTLGFESRVLASLRDALLPKLMSGEIDVEKVKVA